jgi:hypothetical protein
MGASTNQTRENPKQAGNAERGIIRILGSSLRHYLLGTAFALARRGNGVKEEEHQITVLCFVA